MKTIIFFITLFLASNSFGFEIEKIIQKDLTYDGKPEKVIYKVWGESWDAPNWSFTIFEGDNIIHQDISTEAYWKMTVDRGDWQDCNVIADCKEKAFGPDLINRVFDDISVDDNRYDFMLKTFITEAPKRYQLQFNVTEIEAKEYTKRLHDFLSRKTIIGFAILGYHGSLLTYDKFMKTFVTFYTP